jgi:hypothetical protein
MILVRWGKEDDVANARKRSVEFIASRSFRKVCFRNSLPASYMLLDRDEVSRQRYEVLTSKHFHIVVFVCPSIRAAIPHHSHPDPQHCRPSPHP